MTEDEEYYDSIDDAEFEECRSFCNDKFRDDESEPDGDLSNRLKELVPFYTGNIEKSEINALKNDSKSSSITTLQNKKLKRRAPVISLSDRRKNRSYLTMYQAKNEQQTKNEHLKKNTDTSRATCSEFSPKSNLINETDNKAAYEDVGSERLFDRFLEKEDNSELDNDHNSFVPSAYRCESETTLTSKFFSVSEAHFNSLGPSRQRRKRDQSKRSSRPPKTFELGGLGPNVAQEKLELLRKRQDYGKTVSEKNRIKIMENKVVQKLKQEIRKCNRI